MTTRRTLAAAALAALWWVPAACGGGDDPEDAVASLDAEAAADDDSESGDDEGGGGGGRPDSTEFQDAMLEYAQCMRDHGVDMPDPEFDGEGGMSVRVERPAPGTGGERSDEELLEAEEACQPIMEEVAPDIQLDPEEQAEMQDRMVEMAECMRDRGHDMPDPEVSGDGRVRIGSAPGEGGNREDPDDPEFREDLEECQEEAGMEGGPGMVSRGGA